MPDTEPEMNELCDGDPLARALARLKPAPTMLGGTQLIYLAGQAARERAVAFWRRLFVAQSAVLVAVVGTSTFYFLAASKRESQPPQVVERTIVQPVPVIPEDAPMPRTVEPVSGPSGEQYLSYRPAGNRDDLLEYLRIRHEVLTAGLGVLPGANAAPSRPVSFGELEKSLNLPPGVLAAPYRVPPPPPAKDPLPPE